MPIIAPAGITPLVASLDDGVSAAPAALAQLSDAVDPQTGEYQALGSTIHPIDAAVARAFQLKFNAGLATAGKGHRFGEVTKSVAGARRQLVLEARRVLAAHVEAGWISIERVEVSITGDTVEIVVDYRNLYTDREAQVRRTL
jgi:hypothetical protein